MSVLVLMYHATPMSAEEPLDVPIGRFREQIDRLLDAGHRFVPFAHAAEAAALEGSRKVAVTFDDGHGSNTAAIDYLAAKGIRPTMFVVRDWSSKGRDHFGRDGYASARELSDWSGSVSLGSHGSSHTGFGKLSPEALDIELEQSRAFLSELGQAASRELALPGGDGNVPAVWERCEAAGFDRIGNSINSIALTPGRSIPRAVVGVGHDADYPVRLANRSDLAWRLRRSASVAKASLKSKLS